MATASRVRAKVVADTTVTEHLDAASLSEAQLVEAIRAKVAAIRDYTPKIGIFGDTGAGKSSLCNALFGENVAEVGIVQACTRDLQEITVGADADGRGGMVLVDMPGVGENAERSQEYFQWYKELHPKLDLILWVMEARSRAYERSITAYNELFKNDVDRCPVVFVLGQADAVNPVKEWDREAHKPSHNQTAFLRERMLDVATQFDVSARRVCAVSAEEKYNITSLVDTIVEVLPREKKFSFVREARSENVSAEAAQAAQKGIVDTIKEWAGQAYDAIKPHLAEIAVVVLGKVGKVVAAKALSFFRSLV